MTEQEEIEETQAEEVEETAMEETSEVEASFDELAQDTDDLVSEIAGF